MKNIILFTLLFCCSICYAQKPNIQLDSYKTWTEISGGGISGDGKYAFYTVDNFPIGSGTFQLKRTDGVPLVSIIELRNPKFSEDSKHLIGILPSDTLIVIDLPSIRIKKNANVSQYDLVRIGDKQHLITLSEDGSFSISNLKGRTVFLFQNVKQYKFCADGSRLILTQRKTSNGNAVICSLINTMTGDAEIIYEGSDITEAVFDRRHEQIAFVANDSIQNSIYYFRKGMTKASLLVNGSSGQFEKGYNIEPGEYWSFSKDGKSLFFSIRLDQSPIRRNERPGLEIWSYQDMYLRPYFYSSRGSWISRPSYLCKVMLSDGKVAQLLRGDQKIVSGSLKYDTDTIALVESFSGLRTEDWNPRLTTSYYVLNTSEKTLVPLEFGRKSQFTALHLSPRGRYILYYDPETKNYFSYDRFSESKKIITNNASLDWVEYNRLHYPKPEEFLLGVIGWKGSEKYVLIQGTYDIWQFDLSGKESPHCITKGKGMRDSIVFAPAVEYDPENSRLLLRAFNVKNKQFGFAVYSFKSDNLHMIYMNDIAIGQTSRPYIPFDSRDFLQTNQEETFLIRLESSKSAPNYFYIKGSKHIAALSDQQPQRKFNWLTTELHTFRDSLGNQCQGILFKPEDFDPQKKYPIIFNVYEFESHRLNQFDYPYLVSSDCNIPLLVSNGYLFFIADVKGTVKEVGKSALRTVDAAIGYFTKYAWVDTAKMGISGHSFGGFEVNYVITHCNNFSAAISGASISNMMSESNALWGSGEHKQYFEQYGPTLMGAKLIDDPVSYQNNSPVFQAKRLNTPVLFIHNDSDKNVTPFQTQSFFLILRSLQKPCWWLNYKGQGHGVVGDLEEDYNLKVWQFFDYYLKDKPMPEWMKEHI